MKDFNFQPFDKVLVRDSDKQNWHCSFFSHIDVEGDKICIETWYEQIIPYNENTKHLLGTSEPYISPEEAPKFEFGDVVEWEYKGVKYVGIYSKDTKESLYSEVLEKGEYTTTSVITSCLKLIRKGNFNG